MEKCPFCDMPPGQTVWIQYDHMVLPHTAAWACDRFHLAETMRPAIERVKTLVNDAFDKTFGTGT